jgi:hypothetical protein
MISSHRVDLLTIAAFNAVRTFADMCESVSQVAGVPGLGIAGTLVLTIIALCDKASVNGLVTRS